MAIATMFFVGTVVEYIFSVCFRFEATMTMKVYCFKVLLTRCPLREAGNHVTYWL